MANGNGFPQCWVCKNFRRSENWCLLHQAKVPDIGLVICTEFEDADNPNYNKQGKFVSWKKKWLTSNDKLYVYSEGSTPTPYATFDELRRGEKS